MKKRFQRSNGQCLKRFTQIGLCKDLRWMLHQASTEIIFKVFIVLLIFAILLPESPLFKPYLERDSGVFHYIGWLITQGKIPYRDVWDHKPPVIFFINALGLLLAGGSRWGVWGLEAFFLILSGEISLILLKKHFGLFPGFLATLAWVISLPYLLCGWDFATEYGLLFQFLFLWVFSKSIAQEKTGKYWFLLGVLSGLLFLCKQNLVGISLAAGMVAIVLGIRDRKIQKMFSNLTYFTLGGVAVVAVFVIYFGFHHTLTDFWDAAFLYNFSYSRAEATARVLSLSIGLRLLKTSGLSYLSLMGFLIAVMWNLIRKFSPKALQGIITPNPLLLLCLLDFPLELALAVLSGRAYGHYFMAVLPVFAFFAAVSFQVLLMVLQAFFPDRKVGVLFCCVITGAFAVSQMHCTDCFFPFCRSRTSPQIQDTVQYILNNSSPEDKVLILGAETGLNFLSQRVSPTRFVYQYPLIQTGYSTYEQRDEFLKEVAGNQPAIIVNTIRTNSIFMGYEPGYESGEVFATEFLTSGPVQENCLFQKTILNWDIYQCNWGR